MHILTAKTQPFGSHASIKFDGKNRHDSASKWTLFRHQDEHIMDSKKDTKMAASKGAKLTAKWSKFDSKMAWFW